jgi:hypothetical protein
VFFSVYQHMLPTLQVSGAETDALLPGLGPAPSPANLGLPCLPQQTPSDASGWPDSSGGEESPWQARRDTGPRAAAAAAAAAASPRWSAQLDQLATQAQRRAGGTTPRPVRAASRRLSADVKRTPAGGSGSAERPGSAPAPVHLPSSMGDGHVTGQPGNVGSGVASPSTVVVQRRSPGGSDGGAAAAQAAPHSWPGGDSSGLAAFRPWGSLAFHPEGLERAFVAHYSRQREQVGRPGPLLCRAA